MSEDPDYLWDGSGEPPADIAKLKQAVSGLRHDAPLDELRLAKATKAQAELSTGQLPPRSQTFSAGLLGAGVFSVGLAAAAMWLYVGGGKSSPCTKTGQTGFAFTSSADALCADRAAQQGTLPIGETLVVGQAPVEITIANIGTATVGVGSQVSLVTSGPREHRLMLSHGRMHAKVVAPPRLFVVQTPSATAIDLGCEYELAVDRKGFGSLQVQAGMVEMKGPQNIGGVVVVPMGYQTTFGPSTLAAPPLATAAPAWLVAVVADLQQGKPVLASRFDAAITQADAVTLVHLLGQLTAEPRAVVVDKLFDLVPLDSVDVEAAKAGDASEIARWRDVLLARPVDGATTTPMTPGAPGKAN